MCFTAGSLSDGVLSVLYVGQCTINDDVVHLVPGTPHFPSEKCFLDIDR
jgi:hypothetical protein